MILIPTIESYFIAARTKSEFIGLLINEIIDILRFPKNIMGGMTANKYAYINVDGKDIYQQYFIFASQRVLIKKQNQLDQINTK